MKENTFAANFEPHECVIFVQSTKISTHENKAIHNCARDTLSAVNMVIFIGEIHKKCW